MTLKKILDLDPKSYFVEFFVSIAHFLPTIRNNVILSGLLSGNRKHDFMQFSLTFFSVYRVQMARQVIKCAK